MSIIFAVDECMLYVCKGRNQGWIEFVFAKMTKNIIFTSVEILFNQKVVLFPQWGYVSSNFFSMDEYFIVINGFHLEVLGDARNPSRQRNRANGRPACRTGSATWWRGMRACVTACLSRCKSHANDYLCLK